MDTNFKRHAIVSFGIIVASFAVAIFLLNSLAGTISESSAKIINYRSMVDQQNVALASLAGLKAQAPLAEKYQVAMDKLLPSQDDLIGFGQWLNEFAADHGVTATFFFQGTPLAPAGAVPGKAAVSLTITGPLNGITTFLLDAKAKPISFPFEIDSFDLIDSNGAYQITGRGNVFFRK